MSRHQEWGRPPLIQGVRFLWVNLNEPWNYGEEGAKEQVPYSECTRRAWNPEKQTYEPTDPAEKVTIYLPSAKTDSDGNYTGDPAGAEGDLHLVFWNVVSRRWEVFSGSQGGVSPYKLTTTWNYSEGEDPPTATAVPLTPNLDTGVLEVSDKAEPVDVFYSLAPRDADGNYVGVPTGGEGHPIWCTDFGGGLEVVTGEDSIYLVELTEDLLAKSDAAATVKLANDEDGPSVNIHDILMDDTSDPPDQIDTGTILIVHWSEVHQSLVPIAKSCTTTTTAPSE
jgi:hypothetical protein